MGYSGIPPLRLLRFEAVTEKQQLAVILVLLALGVFASYRMRQSRFGRALRAIAGSEPAASALGINVARYKLICLRDRRTLRFGRRFAVRAFRRLHQPGSVRHSRWWCSSFTMLYLGGIGTDRRADHRRGDRLAAAGSCCAA